jgi:hypothetical protein
MEGNMTTRVKIDRHFCGPPESGNGGYVCGMAAAFLKGDVEVTLRRPPPLGTPLDVVIHGSDRVSLSDDSGPIAEGRRTILNLPVPFTPSTHLYMLLGRPAAALRHNPNSGDRCVIVG